MPHPSYYVKIQKKRETSNSRRHFFTTKSDKKRHSNWIGSSSECRSNFVKNETLRFGKRPKNRNASFWNRERLVLRIIHENKFSLAGKFIFTSRKILFHAEETKLSL